MKNKKAQTGEILFDVLGAIIVLGAFLGFSFYQFGGQTQQIQAKVVEFTQDIDSQQFLQSLLKSPIAENDSEPGQHLILSDLLAVIPKDKNTENLAGRIISQKLFTLIPDEEWVFSVNEPSQNYIKNYVYQPSAVIRTGERQFNTIITQTTIPSIDSKVLKIGLTRYQKIK